MEVEWGCRWGGGDVGGEVGGVVSGRERECGQWERKGIVHMLLLYTYM